MRDRSNGMRRNPKKKKIIELSKLTEPITLKHKGKGGGGFLICSCFPNHDAKKLELTKKETQGQIALERVRPQKTQ